MTLHVSATVDERVQQLQQHYPEVFAEELGTITPYLARRKVTPDATPKFFKPLSVPFALRDRVSCE